MWPDQLDRVFLAVCHFTLHQTVGNLWNPGPFHKPCLHCQIFYITKWWRLESISPVNGVAPGFVFPLESLYSHKYRKYFVTIGSLMAFVLVRLNFMIFSTTEEARRSVLICVVCVVFNRALYRQDRVCLLSHWSFPPFYPKLLYRFRPNLVLVAVN